MLTTRVAPPLVLAGLLVALAPSISGAQSTTEPYFEFLMARHLESIGDTDGALAALERAAAADQGSAEIRAEMAAFHLRRSSQDDAETSAREALAISEGNLEAHRVLGLIYASRTDEASRQRQTAQAAAHAREAISHFERVVPDPATELAVHYALGRLYLRVDEPAKAVEALGRVVNQNPTSVQARLALAQAYAESGNLGAAIETLSDIVERRPRVASALAQYQEQAGLAKEAAENYGRALALAPESRELKFRRASALYVAGDYAQAAAFAADAQGQHPDDARFPRLQARALFDGGDPTRAFAVLEEVVSASPRDAQTLFSLAALYNEGDRSADAEQTLRRLLDVEPDSAPALNYLGYLLAERGAELDEAIRLVQRALDTDPDNAAYLDSLGWAYYQRGDLADAERYLAPAAEKLPTNSVIQDHFADLRARQGRWADAISLWMQALDGDGDDIDRDAIEQKIQDAREQVNRP